ncbi:hypothetical protein AAFF_G00108940 [Aldrovandia affinis]|uniref:Uncharacterized protein n=1 Tax=Aldrovandia affinis TaxID=143900 RepID=A0AAD7RU96_9TELE|nr:hypothetical protein AAFF_G00108940 [Aldrovandia affinis]
MSASPNLCGRWMGPGRNTEKHLGQLSALCADGHNTRASANRYQSISNPKTREPVPPPARCRSLAGQGGGHAIGVNTPLPGERTVTSVPACRRAPLKSS